MIDIIRPFLYLWLAPKIAILFDSVAPEVKTISSLLHCKKSAHSLRAPSKTLLANCHRQSIAYIHISPIDVHLAIGKCKSQLMPSDEEESVC